MMRYLLPCQAPVNARGCSQLCEMQRLASLLFLAGLLPVAFTQNALGQSYPNAAVRVSRIPGECAPRPDAAFFAAGQLRPLAAY
jgi:hypothetical protein